MSASASSYAAFVPGAALVPAYYYALEHDFSAFSLILVKLLPIAALLLATVSQTRRTAYSLRVSAGLAVCAVGDALMEVYSLGSPRYFLYGLVAFLFGHAAYLAAFLSTTARAAPLAALPYFALGGTAFWHLGPVVPPGLLLPVAVYTAVISAMGWRALARRGERGCTHASQGLAAVGAFVFMVSDLIIAVNAFHTPVPDAKHYVMATYYTAQVCIAASVVGGAVRRRKGKAL